MKTFTNKKGISYLLLDVPANIRFQLEETISEPKKHFIHYYTGYKDKFGHYHDLAAHDIELPQDNYELIGLSKDVSEEVAVEIVDAFIKYDGQSKPISGTQMFQGYSDGRDRFTAKQSLSSLVQSLGLNNPIILKLIK